MVKSITKRKDCIQFKVYNRRKELYTKQGPQQKEKNVYSSRSITEGKDCTQGKVYNRRRGLYTGHGQ